MFIIKKTLELIQQFNVLKYFIWALSKYLKIGQPFKGLELNDIIKNFYYMPL